MEVLTDEIYKYIKLRYAMLVKGIFPLDIKLFDSWSKKLEKLFIEYNELNHGEVKWEGVINKNVPVHISTYAEIREMKTLGARKWVR